MFNSHNSGINRRNVVSINLFAQKTPIYLFFKIKVILIVQVYISINVDRLQMEKKRGARRFIRERKLFNQQWRFRLFKGINRYKFFF